MPRTASSWSARASTNCRIAWLPRARAGSGPARRSPCCWENWPTPPCCRSAYVGGEYTCRDHRGDPDGRPPMKPIEIAKQREAIRLLQDEILSAKAFQFKPELLRHLAPDHWYDDRFLFLFGSEGYQYPLLQRVLSIQRIVLSRFLDAGTLRSLQEMSLHAEPGQEVLEMPEVFNALTESIWTELPASDADVKKDQAIAISAIRRNLQREHVSRSGAAGPRTEAGPLAELHDADLLLRLRPGLRRRTPAAWRGSTCTRSTRGFNGLLAPRTRRSTPCRWPTCRNCTSRSTRYLARSSKRASSDLRSADPSTDQGRRLPPLVGKQSGRTPRTARA